MKKTLIFAIFIIAAFTIPSMISYAQEQPEDSTESAQSEEADSVREKVQEKIEQVRSHPMAYLGTVTDITEATIQIKAESGEILQLSVSDEGTNFINTTKEIKTVGFEDVAIGDYIVGMGFMNGNKVLEAKRVLITASLKPADRLIAFGTVKEIKEKTLYLIDKQQEEYAFKFPKRWKGPEIEELEKEMKVVVVFKSEKDNLMIRTIEIISPANASASQDSHQ